MEMWEVKECKLSNLFFLSDGNDVYREEYGQKTWHFAAEAQEKADELNGVNVLNPVSEGVIKPQVKVEYEKVECDIWNIATLKDDFEAGLIYDAYHEKLENKASLVVSVNCYNHVYRRIETPVTLESELKEEFDFDVALFDGGLGFIGVDLNRVDVSWSTIHKASELGKKHGK